MTAIGYQTPTGYTPQNPLQENRHRGGFMVSEAPGHLSRDQGILTGGARQIAGTVCGKITDVTTAPTVAATAGNTGNGTLTPDATTPVESNAQPGTYTAKMDGATTFMVFDPSGKELGAGKNGTAFSNQVKFVIAAGSTPFVDGDSFGITIAAGSAKYVQLNPSAADGSEVAAAILFGTTDATLADQKATLITRNCEVNAAELIWPTGITTTQQATATAQLAASGIILR